MSEVLYIPGLGNGRLLTAQRGYVALLNRMRSPEEQIDFFEAKWETDEPYDEKYDRLLAADPRKIFAVSAGAALAVRITIEQPKVEVAHLICGKVTAPETIGPVYQSRAPALLEAVQESDELIKGGNHGNRFVCYVPRLEYDGAIETVHMVVPNAPVVELPPFKHLLAISYTLARYVPGK